MKRFKLFLTTLAMATAMSITVFAGEWKQDTTGWWYQNDDGSYLVNQWYQDFDGKWYYFNETGYLFTDGTTPDGRIVGSDGAWISPVTGEPKTVLNNIENWVIGDLWNRGFCDFSHYEYDGTDNTGSDIDIDYSLQLFKESYKLKAGYDAYINALPEEYASLKTAWNKLSGEADKLYKYYEAGVNQSGESTSTSIFVQYREAFSKSISQIR
ncbi:MAG: hypothetical protein KH366_24665 [Clostridiaceae bacterium]|nr:hypothetical protein [Clostridiaceae bacterium]